MCGLAPDVLIASVASASVRPVARCLPPTPIRIGRLHKKSSGRLFGCLFRRKS